MDTPKVPPDVESVAVEVDNLYHRGDNSGVFDEQIETFKRESAERLVAEKRAKEAKQRALDAVWAEQRGVKAGKVKRRLTDLTAPPGAGYVWFRGSHPVPTEHGRRRSRIVRGWIPSSVAKAIEEEDWGAVSLATIFARLAALHDLCLPARPRILPEPLDDWKKAVRSPDPGVRALVVASFWAVGATRVEGKERGYALGEYLSHVRRHLAKGKPGGASPGPRKLIGFR